MGSYSGPDFIGQGAGAGMGVGATAGGALGSVWGAPGQAVGGAIGAGVGAVTGAIVGAERKRKYKKEMERIQGLTSAEKRQATALAMENAGQQAGQAQAQIARDSLSEGGQRNAGMYKEAQAAVGREAANAGAQAGMQVNQLSQQMAEARRQELMSRMEMDADRMAQQGQQLQEGVAASGLQQNMAQFNQNYQQAVAADPSKRHRWGAIGAAFRKT